MKRRLFRKQNLILGFGILISIAFLSACGSGGSGGDDSSAVSPVSSDLKTLRGVIKGVDGNQSSLKTWNVVHFERDSGITHLGIIDEYGFYSVDNVDLTRPFTLFLLDADYRFQALLATAGTTSTTVRQYLTAKLTTLPTIVHKGSVLRFVDASGITWAEDSAEASADDPTIPKGISLVSRQLALAGVSDVDGDGKINTLDIDIDGDGLPNSFDDDDDKDGTLDIFDAEGNGNTSPASLEAMGDPYFNRDLYYIAVQIMREGESTYYLKFTAKVREDIQVESLSIKGSTNSLDKALQLEISDTGAEKYEKTWDLKLLDDGKSEDGEAGDKVYSAKVKLSSAATLKVPEPGQMYFIRLEQTRSGKTITSDFPYRTPDYDPTRGPTAIALAKEDAGKRKYTPAVAPFGTEATFWSLHLYNASSKVKVYATPLRKSSDADVLLPASIISSGVSYQGEYTAISQERVPGYPFWIVKSELLNVTINN